LEPVVLTYATALEVPAITGTPIVTLDAAVRPTPEPDPTTAHGWRTRSFCGISPEALRSGENRGRSSPRRRRGTGSPAWHPNRRWSACPDRACLTKLPLAHCGSGQSAPMNRACGLGRW